MYRSFRLLAITLATLAGAAGATWLVRYSEHTRVHEVRVVGLTRATEAQIRHLADIQEGEPLVTVDLDRAVAGAERHPWVAHAEARRIFPDTVVLQIRERTVRAVLSLDQLYSVDSDGIPFRRADPEDLDHLLLTGMDAPDLATLVRDEPELARRILRDGLALADAAVATGELRETDLSEVHFNVRSGYALRLRNGGEILLGFRGSEGLGRLAHLPRTGIDLSRPQRIDLGMDRLAVITPL